MVDISNPFRATARAAELDDMPTHQHAREALERNKREGMNLAVKARIGALSATALLLVFLNPNWDVLWYHGLLLALVFIGLAQRRVLKVAAQWALALGPLLHPALGRLWVEPSVASLVAHSATLAGLKPLKK